MAPGVVSHGRQFYFGDMLFSFSLPLVFDGPCVNCCELFLCFILSVNHFVGVFSGFVFYLTDILNL